MSAGTVDLILLAVVAFFALKGLWTGFVRAAVSLLAVGGAWVAMRTWPNAFGLWIAPLVDPHSAAFHLVTPLATFVVAYLALQLGGWLLASVIHGLGLGALDRVAGLALGVLTGLLIGCVPLLVIDAVPPLARWAPVRQVVAHSFFLSMDAQVLRAFGVTPPKR